jgi:aryl-alcohol dehydrogenase-like predicted oxidoreductase
MKKRSFGRTGLDVSQLVFGGGAAGGILVFADEAKRAEALQFAVSAGLNWIDTASSYGDGKSEETIGRHLAQLSPRPHISTKFSLTDADLGDVPGAIRRSLDRSLKRLQSTRVDVLQLHNRIGVAISGEGRGTVLTPDIVLRPGGVADTLDALKREGVITGAGFTALGDAPATVQVADSGRFDSVQVYYNALNPSAAWTQAPAGWRGQDFSGLIAAAKRRGMAMLNIRVFAGGPLASSTPPSRLSLMVKNSSEENEMRCAAAVRAALGDRYGTPAQTALRFVLANPDLTCHLIGLADIAYLKEAIAAVEMGPLPPDAIAKLERLWARDFRAA